MWVGPEESYEKAEAPQERGLSLLVRSAGQRGGGVQPARLLLSASERTKPMLGHC
jgi:hypothetical protein